MVMDTGEDRKRDGAGCVGWGWVVTLRFVRRLALVRALLAAAGALGAGQIFPSLRGCAGFRLESRVPLRFHGRIRRVACVGRRDRAVSRRLMKGSSPSRLQSSRPWRREIGLLPPQI